MFCDPNVSRIWLLRFAPSIRSTDTIFSLYLLKRSPFYSIFLCKVHKSFQIMSDFAPHLIHHLFKKSYKFHSKKGRPDAVVKVVSPSHKVMDSKQLLRI